MHVHMHTHTITMYIVPLLITCTHNLQSVHLAVPPCYQGHEFHYRQMECEQFQLRHGMNIHKTKYLRTLGYTTIGASRSLRSSVAHHLLAYHPHSLPLSATKITT